VYGSLEQLSGGYLYDRKLVGIVHHLRSREQHTRLAVAMRPSRLCRHTTNGPA
jgi:hypothetical protein